MVLSKEIKKFPNEFWKGEDSIARGIACMKYIMEDVLKLNNENCISHINKSFFAKNKLTGMLYYVFDDSPYKALNAVYPGRYMPWEMNMTPSGYWNDIDNAIKSIKWLIEEKLHLSEDEIKKVYSKKIYRENRLEGMLQTCFQGSPYLAINTAYPCKYKEWEFSLCPREFWCRETAITAVKWLIEDILNYSHDDICKNITISFFKKHGIFGALYAMKWGPYDAINAAYPNQFKKTDFLGYHRNNRFGEIANN